MPNECIGKDIEFEEIKKLPKWIRPRESENDMLEKKSQ